MRLSERIKRWRASKGYGVHSPLAFRIVKTVVRPGREYSYYGEERLSLGRETPLLTRRARLLLRFVAELQPSYVWVSPDMPEVMKEAIRLAGGVVRLYDGDLYPDDYDKADMVVVYGKGLKKAHLRKVMTAGKSLIGFDIGDRFTAWVAELMAGGIVFDAAGSVMAVNTADSTVHSYKVSSW